MFEQLSQFFKQDLMDRIWSEVSSLAEQSQVLRQILELPLMDSHSFQVLSYEIRTFKYLRSLFILS